MILIYTQQSTSRLEYVLNHIFTKMAICEYSLLTEKDKFENTKADCKINYSGEKIKNSLFMPPSSLLFEKGIEHNLPKLQKVENLSEVVCFVIENKESDFAFDVFAACFYFLSRYEEYLPHSADSHGRFDVRGSIAYKSGCLKLALVDRWVEYLMGILKKNNKNLKFGKKKLCFTPTYDIDVAYAYLNKSPVISLGGMLRDLLKADFKDLCQRIKVILHKEPDPYDVFGRLRELHLKYDLNPYYFVLFAKRSKFDRGISPKNEKFRKLIIKLSEEGRLGIHASYASSMSQRALLGSEVRNLSVASEKKITANRSHYLKILIPETYRNLAYAEITEDYSMGFVSEIGFRASTCTPFLFFDIELDKPVNLMVHPQIFMENAFYNMKDISVDGIFAEIKPILDEIIKYRGEIVTLFHNQSFGSRPGHCFPANEVYEKIINYVKFHI